MSSGLGSNGGRTGGTRMMRVDGGRDCAALERTHARHRTSKQNHKRRMVFSRPPFPMLTLRNH
jgi:hypothetical protein